MAQTSWQDLIPYYVARSLPPPQMQAFEAQLARDTDLRQEVDEWRRIAAVVWREADTAARHLPPLSPEIYKQLQYRNGAKPVNPTGVPVPGPRIRHTSFGRVNGSPLMFVAGFIVVFLCGGIMLMSAMRQLRPEVITTASPNGTESGFGVAMGISATPAATECMVGFMTNVPGCISMTPSITPLAETWTPNPRATSTPVIVRPIATFTPRPPSLPTMTPQNLMPQPTTDPFMVSLTQTTIAVYSISTVWPDYQCAATNVSGEVLPIYARAEYGEVIDYWQPGTSFPVTAAMYGFWVQLGYAKWVPTNGVSLTGPCDEMPEPTATIQTTGEDLCTVQNTTQNPLPLYSSADAQSQIANYLLVGESEWVIAQSSTGWYEVYHNSQTGWFRPEGLTFQGNCSFVPLASPTNLPAETWTPGPTSVPLQSFFNSTTRAVPVAQTNFYTIPDRGGPILHTVDGGTEWRAIGVTVVGGTEWVSIITWEGAQAWIERSLVTIVDTSIPTPTP
jgi:hypothetical protein